MKLSFLFGYLVGEKAVKSLSGRTKLETMQKISSVVLSVSTFILGFILAENLATFAWSMLFEVLQMWALICFLWYFPSFGLLAVRLKGTHVQKKTIFQYTGEHMGLYSIACLTVFSVIAVILGRIYNGDSSSWIVWILPIFPSTLPIFLNRRFHTVLRTGAEALQGQART